MCVCVCVCGERGRGEGEVGIVLGLYFCIPFSLRLLLHAICSPYSNDVSNCSLSTSVAWEYLQARNYE